MPKIFDRVRQRILSSSEEMTIEEYLNVCKTDKSAFANPFQRLLTGMGEHKIIDTSLDARLGRIFQNRKVKVWDTFSGFYGMEEVIESLYKYFVAAAQGLEEARQILYLLGPPGGGKCQKIDTPIWMSNGALKPIQDIEKGDLVLSHNSKGNLVTKQVTETFVIPGKTPVEIRTARGLTITVADTHRLLTDKGWVLASDLKEDMWIATARYGIFGEERYDLNKLSVLGYLIGDGGISGKSGVNFTNENQQTIDDCALSTHEGFSCELVKRAAYLQYAIRGKNGEGPNYVLHWMRDLGLQGRKSETKFVPSFVFSLSKTCIAHFLSRLYATDGWASVGEKRCEIGYSTSSHQLAKDVVFLLSKFGIPARITSKIPKIGDTEYQMSYTVWIKDNREILTFINEIGIFGKETAIQAVREAIQGKFPKGSLDRIPKSIVRDITELIPASKKDGTSRVKSRLRTELKNEKGVRRFKVQRDAEVLHSEELRDISNDNIYWDTITSVQCLFETETMYDFEVEDSHNYIAEGIVSHNSSIADHLKVLFETQPVYILKYKDILSPVWESPLWLFDMYKDGQDMEEEYGIPRRYLRQPMSPWTLKRLTENGGDIQCFRVVKTYPSQMLQRCIAKTEPADESTQDVSTLVGKVDIRKLADFSQDDADAYAYSGGLCKADNGLLDFVEMFKAPIKVLNPMLDATQSGNYKGTEGIGSLPWSGVILAHCFSEDTELLSKDGWRGIDEVTIGTEFASFDRNTGAIEYHPASTIYVYDYDGEMYHMSSSCADHLVTPNHKMLYESYGNWKECLAEDFFITGAHIPVSGIFDRPDIDFYENDDELRFHVQCVTDGHITYVRKKDGYMTYRFRFKKQRKIDRLIALLQRLGYEYHTGVESATNVTYIDIGKVHPKFTKILSEQHRNLSKRQTDILLEEWSHTDGTISVKADHTHRELVTSIKFHADLLQELCVLSGHKVTCAPKYKEGYDPCYMLSIRLGVSKVKTYAMNKGTVEYTGRVWCPDVAPHHTVIARRNGKVFISHQSNEREWEEFRNSKTNEAFIDRIFLVRVPYCLRLDEEVKIYEKLLYDSDLRDSPCANETLRMLGMCSLASRYEEHQNSNIWSKMKVYNGEVIKDTDPQAKSYIEYRTNGGIKEGMSGMSTRFAFKILSRTFSADAEEIAANPVHLMSILLTSIEQENFSKDVEDKYKNYIKEKIQPDYLGKLEKQLQQAYLESYGDYGQNLFERYFLYADAWIQDNDFRDPDTHMMWSREQLNVECEKVEKAAGIANPKDFRNEIVNYVLRFRAKNNGESPKWTEYEKIKEVIEKRIFTNTEEILPIIAFGRKGTKEDEEKHMNFVDHMVAMGYTGRQVQILVEWFIKTKKSS